MISTQECVGSIHEVLNAGHVVLESHMGSDIDIVNAARISFNQSSDSMDERNCGLINFLMRERHGTPFEMVEFKFDIKAPIFVFREWHRHRIASINEQSARYSILESDFYVPDRDWVRQQVGKPGAYTFERIEDDVVAEEVRSDVLHMQQMAYQQYQNMLNSGIAKEIARVVLPVGIYSRMKWKTNLRALMNFLSLRNHEQAQREIRAYASVIESLVESVCPVTMKAFKDHGRKCP